MLDKTPLEMALEREGQIEYCDECEYVRVVDNTGFCGGRASARPAAAPNGRRHERWD